MSDLKLKYSPLSVPIAMGLTSLASHLTNGWQSLAVDNTVDLYVAALLQVKVKLAAGSPGSDKAVYVYVAGSEDGVQFTDLAVTGLDAAIVLRDPTNLRLLGVIATPDAGGLSYISHPMPVEAAFGGILPRKWSVIIRNYSGLAFTATPSDHVVSYTGSYVQTV